MIKVKEQTMYQLPSALCLLRTQRMALFAIRKMLTKLVKEL